jgi:hypothetical protein
VTAAAPKRRRLRPEEVTHLTTPAGARLCDARKGGVTSDVERTTCRKCAAEHRARERQREREARLLAAAAEACMRPAKGGGGGFDKVTAYRLRLAVIEALRATLRGQGEATYRFEADGASYAVVGTVEALYRMLRGLEGRAA